MRSYVSLLLTLIFVASGCSRIKEFTSSGNQNPGDVEADVEAEAPQDAIAMIDGTPILLDEFLAQYYRSATMDINQTDDSKGEYLDFLDRYVGYRVKILEAEAAGYGVDPDLIAESEQYRTQLARPYLLKNEVTDPLVREYFERRQIMVSASHILIRLGQNPVPADTLVAWESMQSIRDSLLAGADFGDMAFRFSEDPSASRVPEGAGFRGNLGFFGAGSVVYEFENAAYETNPGQISDVFRTQFGYHILLVHERKAFPADLRLAHIMIRVSGNSPADSLAARSQIDDIKKKLDSGDEFSELAAQYSADTATGSKGGELQRIKYDSGLPPSMRDVAFGMNIGEISDVVESPFGFHIMKLLGVYPKDTLEESYDDIKTKIAQLPRSKSAEAAWKREARASYDVDVDSEFLLEWAESLGPDGSGSAAVPDSLADRIVATVGSTSRTLKEFLDAHEADQSMPRVVSADNILFLVDAYVTNIVVDEEIAALETRDSEFAVTMTEFRRGLLLFKLMEDSVWTAAAVDSAGLYDYYISHADSFQFGDRTRIVSFSLKSDSIGRSIVDSIRDSGDAASVISTLEADTLSSVRIDTTYIEGETGSIYDQIHTLQEGAVTDLIPYNNGYIVLYHAGGDPARLRTFEEARALAVTGYQEVLDDNLLDRLYIKFRVTTYPGVLESHFDEAVN